MAMIGRKMVAARREIQAQMDQLDGLTAGKAGTARRGRPPGKVHALRGRKIEPKYRGPNGETWAGRGMMPLWLRDAMKGGRKLESFAIGKGGKRAKGMNWGSEEGLVKEAAPPRPTEELLRWTPLHEGGLARRRGRWRGRRRRRAGATFGRRDGDR